MESLFWSLSSSSSQAHPQQSLASPLMERILVHPEGPKPQQAKHHIITRSKKWYFQTKTTHEFYGLSTVTISILSQMLKLTRPSLTIQSTLIGNSRSFMDHALLCSYSPDAQIVMTLIESSIAVRSHLNKQYVSRSHTHVFQRTS
ncbi:unnamed protein product [Lupinus luteus]|uniref:Uncharacterized protein n=1 Tax=Lupinus luteus TaxID=3873 RepID=A0AAV1WP45_LUPLU